MDFVDFPLLVGAGGRLALVSGPDESILKLLAGMARTPRRGWRGAEAFGLRDLLAELQTRHDARLAAVKQINAAFLDLGIDWVRVEDIRFEHDAFGEGSYFLTLAYAGKGVEVQELKL